MNPPESRSPVVEARGVSKVYSRKVPVTALVGADLRIDRGEMIALQGPSGSGKSTLLGLLGLLDVPTSGSISVNNIETRALGERGRSRLRASSFGFVFQQFNLIPHLTATENVATALLYRGLSSTNRKRKAAEVLGQVGLSHRLGHKPGELSGGEQQRVALARAVVAGPDVILADEPTGNLDSGSAEGVLELLGSFVEDGVAVVVATHDPDVAARARWRYRMRDGQLSEGL
jgi:putative ABC transport system ATP-binding protein